MVCTRCHKQKNYLNVIKSRLKDCYFEKDLAMNTLTNVDIPFQIDKFGVYKQKTLLVALHNLVNGGACSGLYSHLVFSHKWTWVRFIVVPGAG